MKHSTFLSYLCLIGIILGLFVSCKKQGAGNNNRAGSSPVVPVDGFVVSASRFENTMTATANLLPAESVEIKAPVSGTVLSIHFKEGQSVSAGQSLVHIDDRIWEAQIKGYKAQLVSARSDLERKQQLLKAEGASQDEVDKAQSTVDQLEAKIDELFVYVSLAAVPAPFAGRVGMRDFSVGAYLSAGQVITTIAQASKLKIDFNLPGKYVGQIKVGDQIKLLAGGDTLQAPVYAINPVVDEASRSIQVRALLDNKTGLAPGDFAEVELPLDVTDRAIMIPTSAVVPELGAETVYLAVNGKAGKRKITSGLRTDKYVQVLDGLSAGDTLITSGLMQIREGMPVKIRKTESFSNL